jgi:hypothetical protein
MLAAAGGLPVYTATFKHAMGFRKLLERLAVLYGAMGFRKLLERLAVLKFPEKIMLMLSKWFLLSTWWRHKGA